MSNENIINEQNTNSPDPFEAVTDPSETADEFLQKLDLAHERWNTKGWWIFRGQNDATWELIPSLFRNWDANEAARHELDLIDSFIRTANLANLPIPGNSLSYSGYVRHDGAVSTIRQLVDLAGLRLGRQYDYSHVVFAIAQHSGIPTRLLDFTYDPLVAAYFAANWDGLLESLEISPNNLADYFQDSRMMLNKSREDALLTLERFSVKVTASIDKLPSEMAVWAISLDDLQNTTIGWLDHPFDQILNLKSQKGVFICETESYEVNGEPWRSFDKNLSALVEREGIYKLTLPVTQREALSDRLGKKLISSLYLTPSYEMVAKTVVEGKKKESKSTH